MKRGAPSIAMALLALALAAAGHSAPDTRPSSPRGSVALTVLPDRTVVNSGGDLRVTLIVRSTGTEAAPDITTCLAPPVQLTISQARGGERKGRRVCFSLGNLPAGAQRTRAVVLKAAAVQSVAVQLSARANSGCACSGRPAALSPVIRVEAPGTRPPVTG